MVVFGTLGILTKDARFLMLKPSMIYIAIGVVMLKRGWMLRYLPPIAGGRGEPLMVAWGYVWAGLMFVDRPSPTWRRRLAPPERCGRRSSRSSPLASKLTLFAIQYASVSNTELSK